MITAGKIFLSNGLINKLGIPLQRLIQVRVGVLIVTAELVIQKDDRLIYMLSPTLAQALYIKKRKNMKIRYDAENGHIHLGPTIGILSTFLPNKADFEATSVQADLMFLSDVSVKLPGQIYIFTPSSINWDNGTTRGYLYRPVSATRGMWVTAVYPLPDVVYDRISSRTSENKEHIKSAKTKLCSYPHLKYFNPYFLNKLKVHQMLISNPGLHDHLPETRPLTAENLNELLEKYGMVFIKPNNGSLGFGIIKAQLDHQNNLNYVICRRRRVRNQVENAEDFMKKTKAYRDDKPYLVQQGLDLATYRGAPFDIRIIYQKDGTGEWQISKKFARVAPPGSSISNLSSGGRVELSRRVLRYLFRQREVIEGKNRQIQKLCQDIATTLEKASGAVFGELGLDIGIDKKGNPYLIEVNSKPRKTIESDYSLKIVRNTFIRPLEYSVYLAGF